MRRNNKNIAKVLLQQIHADESCLIRFKSRLKLPKLSPDRKTGSYLSLREACKLIGIDQKTYIRNEGKLFPKTKRLGNGFRVFEYEDAMALRHIWKAKKMSE